MMVAEEHLKAYERGTWIDYLIGMIDKYKLRNWTKQGWDGELRKRLLEATNQLQGATASWLRKVAQRETWVGTGNSCNNGQRSVYQRKKRW